MKTRCIIGLLLATLLVFGASVSTSSGALPINALSAHLEPHEDDSFSTNTPLEIAPREVEKKEWHPSHQVIVWKTRYRGRVFRVTRLPRCEHIEALITYSMCGETIARAKKRYGAIAACSGSFHNSRTLSLADFVQRDGEIVSSARTGRCFVSIDQNGVFDISRNYCAIKGKPGISALALGQRLIPLRRDGFSVAFMNRVTSRMAIGLDDNHIFIVQGRSSVWRLADFMNRKLPCKIAINSDGGHVVHGRSPVHIVFRWKTSPTLAANSRNEAQGRG